jgi:hypothetical protein
LEPAQVSIAQARRLAYSLNNQLDVVLTALPTYVKVLLALEPRALIAVMHTTIIRANMTAYSTAVGPSSFLRKLTRDFVKLDMDRFLYCRVLFVFAIARAPSTCDGRTKIK